jgi:hypothetical protein
LKGKKERGREGEGERKESGREKGEKRRGGKRVAREWERRTKRASPCK